MTKIKVNYIDPDNNLFFSELLEQIEIPRTNEYIIWMGIYLHITRIERNFDKKEINVFVEKL